MKNASVLQDETGDLPLSTQVKLLWERIEDIPLLAETFFRRIQLKNDKPRGISPEAMQVLVRSSRPGNVRELKSAFEYAFVTCMDSMHVTQTEKYYMPIELRGLNIALKIYQVLPPIWLGSSQPVALWAG